MKNFIDQPYVETTSRAETAVAPDMIYMSILLDEVNSKGKISLEDIERDLVKTLQNLNIDTERDLSLLSLNSKHKAFFIKTDINKAKLYSLLVHDAVVAGCVLTDLEKVGIANVTIDKVVYSQAEELLLELKGKALVKAKESVTKTVELINQKVGKAIYIREIKNSNTCQHGQGRYFEQGMSSLSKKKSPLEPIFLEFKKINFEVELKVRFLLE